MPVVQTTVTNVSGAARYFAWIPPHGFRLGNGQSRTVLGILEDRLNHERDRAQFYADVAAGNVTVTHNL